MLSLLQPLQMAVIATLCIQCNLHALAADLHATLLQPGHTSIFLDVSLVRPATTYLMRIAWPKHGANCRHDHTAVSRKIADASLYAAQTWTMRQLKLATHAFHTCLISSVCKGNQDNMQHPGQIYRSCDTQGLDIDQNTFIPTGYRH